MSHEAKRHVVAPASVVVSVEELRAIARVVRLVVPAFVTDDDTADAARDLAAL